MARRQHNNSISLFPFLAVLVCAMGALILLLLVMTRKIRHDQQDRADELAAIATVTESSDLSEEMALIQQQVDHLLAKSKRLQKDTEALAEALESDVSSRDDLEQQLADLAAQLDAKKDAINGVDLAAAVRDARELTQQEKDLLQQLDAAEKLLLEKKSRLAAAQRSSESARLLLQQKNSALLSLRKRIEEAQQAPATSGTATLLEFTNTTGTAQTPIVIEVTSKGYELLPSGVLITPPELDNFPIRDNPLLSAVLTAHRFRSGNSVANEPYVLLMVRPDGSVNYYRAQHILKESTIHFGYELLETEKQVVVAGEVDPREALETKRAIAEALQRREKLYGKLIAIMEQERGRSGRSNSATSGNLGAADADSAGETSKNPRAGRRLVVRPDGRVLEDAAADGSPLPSRFYAGGVAPPAEYLEKRPVAGFAPRTDGQMSAEEAETLVEEFAKQYARQQQQLAARPNSNDAPVGSAEAMETSEAASFAAHEPTAIPGERDVSARDLLPGNVASRAAKDMKAVAESTHPPNAIASRSTSAESLFARNDFSAEPSSSEQSRSDDTAYLSVQRGNPNASPDSSMGPRSKQESVNGPVDPFATSADPSAQQMDTSRIDPDLLKRLAAGKAGKNKSIATPIGITVFLDERHLTVSQQPTLELTEQSLPQAFSLLLGAVDAEVKEKQRSPDEPIMPIVKFVVSPGGELWRIRLAPMLKHIGLHSAAVYELTPYIKSADSFDTVDAAGAGDPAGAGDTTGRARFASHSEGVH